MGKKGQGRTGIRKKERKGNFKCASGDVKVKGKRQDKTLTMRKRKKAVKIQFFLFFKNRASVLSGRTRKIVLT